LLIKTWMKECGLCFLLEAIKERKIAELNNAV